MPTNLLFSAGIVCICLSIYGPTSWLCAQNAKAPTTDSGDTVRGDGILLSEFIYETAPFPQCHASTIVQAADGTLIAGWFGGTKEKDPDVGIWISRREANGWSKPVEVANGVQPDGSRFPTWNPVLFQPRNGPLQLYFKVGPSPSEWWGEVLTSSDHGAHWGDRQRLPQHGIGPVKNKPVEMEDGAIWCPSSTEDHGWQIHLEVTRDLGKHWEKIGPLNPAQPHGAIQPSLLTHRDGSWQLLSRDQNSNGNIWQCWSKDQGKTWTALESTGLPNPNSGIDAVTLKDGRQLLIYNHTIRKGDFPSGRQMLNLAISENGRDWLAAVRFEKDKGEYSYPAIIQTNDGLVHITYTWKRTKVRHVVLDPQRLKGIPFDAGRWPESL